mmetsp:Transcript_22009/g.54009  ORF Transcript_22009/g.54009 Transcript_22009/m.54009 type:complete len:291 (-) Transcript_22009:218-1090(-)
MGHDDGICVIQQEGPERGAGRADSVPVELCVLDPRWTRCFLNMRASRLRGWHSTKRTTDGIDGSGIRQLSDRPGANPWVGGPAVQRLLLCRSHLPGCCVILLLRGMSGDCSAGHVMVRSGASVVDGGHLECGGVRPVARLLDGHRLSPHRRQRLVRRQRPRPVIGSSRVGGRRVGRENRCAGRAHRQESSMGVDVWVRGKHRRRHNRAVHPTCHIAGGDRAHRCVHLAGAAGRVDGGILPVDRDKGDDGLEAEALVAVSGQHRNPQEGTQPRCRTRQVPMAHHSVVEPAH